jgi:hypothetical protein
VYDLGETYPATVLVRDENSTLVNPTTITFTFTRPDATTDTPTPANPATGTFQYDEPLTQFGLWRFRAVSTGPATAYADAFNVVSSDWPAFVGLAEVKNHLNIAASNTTHDEELRGFVLSASAVVEDIVGTVARKTYTETYSGRGETAILLRHRPVLSVTSVTVNGSAVTDFSCTEHGILSRASTYSALTWPRGVDNVAVVYQAGRVAPPWNVLNATKELIRINWRPQTGGNYSVFDGGRGDDFGQGAEPAEIRLGFFVPNTVMQRLQPSARAPHVA